MKRFVCLTLFFVSLLGYSQEEDKQYIRLRNGDIHYFSTIEFGSSKIKCKNDPKDDWTKFDNERISSVFVVKWEEEVLTKQQYVFIDLKGTKSWRSGKTKYKVICSNGSDYVLAWDLDVAESNAIVSDKWQYYFMNANGGYGKLDYKLLKKTYYFMIQHTMAAECSCIPELQGDKKTKGRLATQYLKEFMEKLETCYYYNCFKVL